MPRPRPRRPRSPRTAPPGAGDALALDADGLRYALDREPSKDGAKVVVSVALAEGPEGPPFVDTANLYAYRARVELAARVADAFARRPGDVLGHLAQLLDQVERAREDAARAGPEPLTPRRREAAEALLAQVALLDRAAEALEALGYVGEEATKRLVLLVAVSRLLERPLSALLVAPLASGKSELLDKLSRLLPPEALEYLSRISPAALYYAGPDHLRHKVVIVDEQAGSAESEYPIRTLQTKGFLRVAVTVKGRIESFEARGPIALLSSTTEADQNPENLSRCLVLPLDDSPEQTRRVQAAQRRAWAGREAQPFDAQPWQDAQRLLEALPVVIPYAERLAFPARATRDRREQEKLLALVAAHALLHQRQRGRDERGRLVAELGDYRAVHGLVRRLLDAELDGLSLRAARLYRLLAEGERPALTRREAAELLGVAYNTAKAGVEELLRHELVHVVGTDRPRRYRVADRSLLEQGAALTPPEALEGPAKRPSRRAARRAR